MGAPHAARRSGRASKNSGTPVDSELSLVIEDDEHLFHLVVIVMADAAFRRNHASMQEDQIRIEGSRVEQTDIAKFAGAAVDVRGFVIRRLVIVGDALFERL